MHLKIRAHSFPINMITPTPSAAGFQDTMARFHGNASVDVVRLQLLNSHGDAQDTGRGHSPRLDKQSVALEVQGSEVKIICAW
jgi:hypothetical protein